MERASRPPKVSESMVTPWARNARTPSGAKKSAVRAAARIRPRPRPNRPGMRPGLLRRAGLAGRWLAGIGLGSLRLGRLGGGRRHLVARVIELRVQLDLVEDDVLLLGMPLGARLDRVRDHQASDLLVVADRALELDLAAAHHPLPLALDLEHRIGV